MAHKYEKEEKEEIKAEVKQGNPFSSAFKGTIGKGCGCVTLVIVGFILLGIIAGLGSSSKEEGVSKQTPSKVNEDVIQQTTSPEEITETQTPIEKREPFTLTGSGQQASEMFSLNKGLAIFKMEYSGSSNFSIRLLDKEGNYIELLVNEIGSFDGSKAVQIPRDDTYLLDIDASGPWTVTIK